MVLLLLNGSISYSLSDYSATAWVVKVERMINGKDSEIIQLDDIRCCKMST